MPTSISSIEASINTWAVRSDRHGAANASTTCSTPRVFPPELLGRVLTDAPSTRQVVCYCVSRVGDRRPGHRGKHRFGQKPFHWGKKGPRWRTKSRCESCNGSFLQHRLSPPPLSLSCLGPPSGHASLYRTTDKNANIARWKYFIQLLVLSLPYTILTRHEISNNLQAQGFILRLTEITLNRYQFLY